MQQPQDNQRAESPDDLGLLGQVNQSGDYNESAHHHKDSGFQASESAGSFGRQSHVPTPDLSQTRHSMFWQGMRDGFLCALRDPLFIFPIAFCLGFLFSLETIESVLSGIDPTHFCNTAPAATGN